MNHGQQREGAEGARRIGKTWPEDARHPTAAHSPARDGRAQCTEAHHADTAPKPRVMPSAPVNSAPYSTCASKPHAPHSDPRSQEYTHTVDRADAPPTFGSDARSLPTVADDMSATQPLAVNPTKHASSELASTRD
eukprot:5083419-Pleurochrysis_carterae.AAC.8